MKALTAALLGVTLLIGTAANANAADAYDPGGMKDEPAPAALPTWAGLYVGGSVGYGWGDVSDHLLVFGTRDSGNLNGAIYGGHIGYNIQRGNIVFGAEAGFNGTTMDGSAFDGNFEHEVEWYGTGVGRLGYAYGDLLLYGFGGVAWGKVKTTLDVDGVNRDEATHVGWTAGLGLERAFSDHLSIRLEYSHVDLGSETIFKSSIVEDAVDASFDAVKIGVNYRLTGDSPLDALK